MPVPQLELFSQPQPSANAASPAMADEMPDDFIARIRQELEATLDSVRRAVALPWPDLTRATLAELRFNSIAGWLSETEAASLRAAFETEMSRLYEIEDDRPAEA